MITMSGWLLLPLALASFAVNDQEASDRAGREVSDG